MTDREREIIAEFLASVGKPDLYAYYGLDPLAPADEVEATLKRRRSWAQGQQSNPKFRGEALFLIKQNALVRRTLLEDASDYRASLDATPTTAPEPSAPTPTLAAPVASVEDLPELEEVPDPTEIADTSASEATRPEPVASEGEDLYAVLAAPRLADAEDLGIAYRDRLRYLRFTLPAARLSTELARLERAWRVLGSPARRARYDAGESVDELLADPPTVPQSPDNVTTLFEVPEEDIFVRPVRSEPPAPAPPASRESRARPTLPPPLTNTVTLPRTARLEVDCPDTVGVTLMGAPYRFRLVIRNAGTGRMPGRVFADRTWLDVNIPHLDADNPHQVRIVTIDPAVFPGTEGSGTLTVLTDHGERRVVRVEVRRRSPFAWVAWAAFALGAVAVFSLGFWWVSRDIQSSATQLLLHVTPPASHVYVGGRERGAGADVQIELELGQAHRLRVEADGYEPHEELLQGLGPGRVERRITLQPERPDSEVVLGAEAVQLVEAKGPALAACFRRDGAPAILQATFVAHVASGGGLLDVMIEDANAPTNEAEGCVREVFESLTFPAFTGRVGVVRARLAVPVPGAAP